MDRPAKLAENLGSEPAASDATKNPEEPATQTRAPAPPETPSSADDSGPMPWPESDSPGAEKSPFDALLDNVNEEDTLDGLESEDSEVDDRPTPVRLLAKGQTPIAGEREAGAEVERERHKVEYDLTRPGIPSLLARQEAETKAQATSVPVDLALDPAEVTGPAPELPPSLLPPPLPSAPSEPRPQQSQPLRTVRPEGSPPSPKGRSTIGAFLFGCGAMALFFSGAAGVVWYMRPTPMVYVPPPAPLIAPPAPQRQAVQLRTMVGTVERFGLDGEWQPIPPEAELLEGEQVRTGDASSAVLRVAEAEIELGEHTRLAIRATTTAQHRFRLNAGIITLRYVASGVPFTLESNVGQVVASGKAEAVALADGAHLVLACHAGQVELAAGDKRLTVPAGKVAATGTAGALPAAVADQTDKVQIVLETPEFLPERHVFVLEGRLTGGPAALKVYGLYTPVGADGRFTVELKAPAKGPFIATAMDAALEPTSATFPLLVKGLNPGAGGATAPRPEAK